jgi:hypothetical protein
MRAQLGSETAVKAAIERLALDARHVRRCVEHARTEADKRVLNRQLAEIQVRIDQLKATLR